MEDTDRLIAYLREFAHQIGRGMPIVE